jgi:hypothetical protein
MQRRDLLWSGGVLAVLASFSAAIFGSPTPTALHDLFVVNRREEPVRVGVELRADGRRVVDRTLALDAGDRVHVGCSWPSVAVSYAASIRLPEADALDTVRWDDTGRVCKKIAVEAESVDAGVTFYTSQPCPTNRPGDSCG